MQYSFYWPVKYFMINNTAFSNSGDIFAVHILYFEIPHLQSIFHDFAEFNAMQDEVMIVAY